MARLPYVDPETASPRIRGALEALPPLNVFRMLSNADTAFAPFLQFGGAVLQYLELDQVLRELIILQVAKQTNAEYEWVQHEAIAKAVGATEEQVRAVEAGDLDSDSLGPEAQALLKFIVQFFFVTVIKLCKQCSGIGIGPLYRERFHSIDYLDQSRSDRDV